MGGSGAFGVVLGAGGLTGEAFHRGVVRALRDTTGWDARDADAVVGTSAGSIMAASLCASGLPVPEPVGDAPPAPDAAGAAGSFGVLGLLPSALPVAAALAGAALRPWRARPGALASVAIPAGTRSLDWLADGVERRYGPQWPQRHLWVVALRRRDGRRVVFGREGSPECSVGRAVAASCSIPGYFAPVAIAGEEYVDGGGHSPTNADLLGGRGLDHVVVSSPMSVHPSGLASRLDLPLRLMWHRYLAGEARALRREGTEVITVEPNRELLQVMSLNMMAPHHIDEVEERAMAVATEVFTRALHRGRMPRSRPSADRDARAGV